MHTSTAKSPDPATTTPPRPVVGEPQWSNLPLELTSSHQWVLWSYELIGSRWTKVPRQPDGSAASSTDPATWAPFDFCQISFDTSDGRFDGVGFVLTAADPFVAFDFDDCLNAAGNITVPKISDYVARLDSYTEVTPSGMGLRVITRGKLPPQDRKLGACEVYSDQRFVTLTGAIYG
jgi:putative DNA primase/helicase